MIMPELNAWGMFLLVVASVVLSGAAGFYLACWLVNKCWEILFGKD